MRWECWILRSFETLRECWDCWESVETWECFENVKIWDSVENVESVENVRECWGVDWQWVSRSGSRTGGWRTRDRRWPGPVETQSWPPMFFRQQPPMAPSPCPASTLPLASFHLSSDLHCSPPAWVLSPPACPPSPPPPAPLEPSGRSSPLPSPGRLSWPCCLLTPPRPAPLSTVSWLDTTSRQRLWRQETNPRYRDSKVLVKWPS